MAFKSGFVALIGRPNVGKSTLLNNIIGEKIAIISDKPQTTRNKIQCVYTEENLQIVFLDTPGIHKPKNELGKYMVNTALSTLKEVDVLLWMVDNSKHMGKGDTYIYEKFIKQVSTPKILVINKVDKSNTDDINKIINKYEKTNVFNDVVPISALKDRNIGTLINSIKKLLPSGPQYFPEDMITDQPERQIIMEIIREKALRYLQQEVPHGIAVDIIRMKKRDNDDIIDINAVIYCERKSHKGIIIGKGGRKLKGIGKSARIDIERLMGSKIYLDLWVKVSKDWRQKQNLVKKMGYK